MSQPLYIALIRTHHVTSLKKIAKLRAAGAKYNGSETAVKEWVSTVQRLRYKDFHLVKRPAIKLVETKDSEVMTVESGKLEIVESVKQFGVRMSELGVLGWWRRGMGYSVGDDENLK